MIYIVVPTFKETELVKKFMQNFNNCSNLKISVVIVNANYQDDTSKFIHKFEISTKSNISIKEIIGRENEFWSATVNRGFEYVKGRITELDSIYLCNIDIQFDINIFSDLNRLSIKHSHNSILAPVSIIRNRHVKSSGIFVKNWFFDIKIHPLAGFNYDDIKISDEISVDFLATRLIIIPYKAFVLNWRINDKMLPHYAADYDYTQKFKRLGFNLFIVPSCSILVDSNNTGLSVYSLVKSNVFIRLYNLFNIKNPSNPFYRLIFVFRNYPLYSIPIVSLINIFKIAIETLLGGRLIKSLFAIKQRGIS